MIETLRATEVLANEGFQPMVYCADDPIAAKKLEDAGAVAIMPLGAPIGSGLGLQNQVMIRIMVENAQVPVLVDAGVGTASDATRSEEHTSELQSLMRISYADSCLKQKNKH